MKKRQVVFLVAILILSLVFTGCGNSNKTGDQNASDNPRQAYEGTTLRVLLKTGYEAEAVKQFKEDFEKETGIKVEYEIYDEPTMRNKFVLDSTSKTGTYDVVATQFWYMPEYLQADWLEPLDSYIDDQSDKDWDPIAYIPGGLLDTYRDAEGKLYSIPVSASGGVLMYRQDILDKHGIKAPETTEEVLAAARDLSQKEEIFPFVARGDSSMASFGTSAGWAWAYGARVLDDEGNVTVNSPEMKKAMTDYVELMSKFGPPDQAAVGWDVMSEIYRQGKAVMNIDMSGFPSVYSNPEVSSVSDKIGVSLLKGPADNYVQWIYGEGLGISKYSKNKEAAWLFLQWRNSLDVSKKEVEAGLRFDFPDTRVYETDLYKGKAADLEFFTSQLPDIMDSVDTAYWPNTAQFQKVAEAFQKQISLAISGNQTVDQALEKAQKDIEAIVSK